MSSFRTDTTVFGKAAVTPTTTRTVTISSFPGTENPAIQNGIWTNGAATGVNWSNMQITGGIICGTQAAGSFDGHYCDSAALLTGYGTWNSNQEVEAVVKSINQVGGSNFCEVEIRLRCNVWALDFQGYELLWRANHDGSQYHQIGYWYGPIGINGGCALGCAFAGVPGSVNYNANGMEASDNVADQAAGLVAWGTTTYGGIYDGDTVRASIVGNRIRTYVVHNGTTVLLEDFNDTGATNGGALFTSGYPGLGHWNHSASAPTDFGFTSAIFREL